MNKYRELIESAEFALSNGEYKYCIELINPLIEDFPVSTKEGTNLRMTLITAYSGINRKEEAIVFCKQLLKSRYSHIRENAKSLIEVLNSPDLKIPEDWNIKLDNNIKDINHIKNSQISLKRDSKKQKFINTNSQPMGETKTFQKGFIILTSIILISLITLLSGCVRIDSELDLRKIDSINIDFEVKSKYVSKIPWQLNFEKKLKNNFPNSDFFTDDNQYILKERNLELKEAKNILNQIFKIVSNTSDLNIKNLKFEYLTKNYFLGKKYFFDIDFDLSNLDNLDGLEIFIKIINPSKVNVMNENKQITYDKQNINWILVPGETNNLSFILWDWNKLSIAFLLIIFLIFIAYFIRSSRYELGSNLPELPS